MAERRVDTDLRDRISDALSALDESKRDRAAIRKIVRSLKRWTLGLTMWIAALSLIGYAENSRAVDRIQASRIESVERTCLQSNERHAQTVTQIETATALRVSGGKTRSLDEAIARLSGKQRMSVVEQRAQLRSLLDAAFPLHPSRFDHRSCHDYAEQTVEG